MSPSVAPRLDESDDLPRSKPVGNNEFDHSGHSSSSESTENSEGKRTGQRPDSKSAGECKNVRENEGFSIRASGITSPETFVPVDPVLAVVAQKWAALPEAGRAGILAMVNATVPDAPTESFDEASVTPRRAALA